METAITFALPDGTKHQGELSRWEDDDAIICIDAGTYFRIPRYALVQQDWQWTAHVESGELTQHQITSALTHDLDVLDVAPGQVHTHVASGLQQLIAKGKITAATQSMAKEAVTSAIADQGIKITSLNVQRRVALRSDLHVVRALASDGSVVLGYQATASQPSDDEILVYVEETMPGRHAVDAWDIRPGRIKVATRTQLSPDAYPAQYTEELPGSTGPGLSSTADEEKGDPHLPKVQDSPVQYGADSPALSAGYAGDMHNPEDPSRFEEPPDAGDYIVKADDEKESETIKPEGIDIEAIDDTGKKYFRKLYPEVAEQLVGDFDKTAASTRVDRHFWDEEGREPTFRERIVCTAALNQFDKEAAEDDEVQQTGTPSTEELMHGIGEGKGGLSMSDPDAASILINIARRDKALMQLLDKAIVKMVRSWDGNLEKHLGKSFEYILPAAIEYAATREGRLFSKIKKYLESGSARDLAQQLKEKKQTQEKKTESGEGEGGEGEQQAPEAAPERQEKALSKHEWVTIQAGTKARIVGSKQMNTTTQEYVATRNVSAQVKGSGRGWIEFELEDSTHITLSKQDTGSWKRDGGVGASQRGGIDAFKLVTEDGAEGEADGNDQRQYFWQDQQGEAFKRADQWLKEIKRLGPEPVSKGKLEEYRETLFRYPNSEKIIALIDDYLDQIATKEFGGSEAKEDLPEAEVAQWENSVGQAGLTYDDPGTRENLKNRRKELSEAYSGPRVDKIVKSIDELLAKVDDAANLAKEEPEKVEVEVDADDLEDEVLEVQDQSKDAPTKESRELTYSKAIDGYMPSEDKPEFPDLGGLDDTTKKWVEAMTNSWGGQGGIHARSGVDGGSISMQRWGFMVVPKDAPLYTKHSKYGWTKTKNEKDFLAFNEKQLDPPGFTFVIPPNTKAETDIRLPQHARVQRPGWADELERHFQPEQEASAKSELSRTLDDPDAANISNVEDIQKLNTDIHNEEMSQVVTDEIPEAARGEPLPTPEDIEAKRLEVAELQKIVDANPNDDISEDKALWDAQDELAAMEAAIQGGGGEPVSEQLEASEQEVASEKVQAVPQKPTQDQVNAYLEGAREIANMTPEEREAVTPTTPVEGGTEYFREEARKMALDLYKTKGDAEASQVIDSLLKNARTAEQLDMYRKAMRKEAISFMDTWKSFHIDGLERRGNDIVATVQWDSDSETGIATKSDGAVKHAVRHYIVGMSSQKEHRSGIGDLGNIGRVRFMDFDPEAGFAVVAFRSTDAAMAPGAFIDLGRSVTITKEDL